LPAPFHFCTFRLKLGKRGQGFDCFHKELPGGKAVGRQDFACFEELREFCAQFLQQVGCLSQFSKRFVLLHLGDGESKAFFDGLSVRFAGLKFLHPAREIGPLLLAQVSQHGQSQKTKGGGKKRKAQENA
jgi:hypothetical protein